MGVLTGYRIDISNQLNYHINDNDAYKGRHTNGQEGAFTRNRLLPFGHLILTCYAVSPSLLPRPSDWPLDIQVTGFLTMPRKNKHVGGQSEDGLGIENGSGTAWLRDRERLGNRRWLTDRG